ncbi:Mitochondrial distribution and morphology protein 10 [Mitosporidium daphniae]
MDFVLDNFLYSAAPELKPFSSIHNNKLYLALCTESKSLYDFQVPSSPLCVKVSTASIAPRSLLQFTLLPSLCPSFLLTTSNINSASHLSHTTSNPLQRILGFFPAFPKWAFALSSSKALCKVNTKSLLLINPKVLLQVNTSLNFSKKELSTIQSFFNINEPFGLPIYSEASFQYDNSGSHIGGIRGVFHFKKYSSVEFSMGGEAYFSMKDQIGGVGTVLRAIVDSNSSLIVACNPFLGHLSSTYSTGIPLPRLKNLKLSSRFDFNVHSLESNFATGVEICKSAQPPNVNESASPPPSSYLCACYSECAGTSFVYKISSVLDFLTVSMICTFPKITVCRPSLVIQLDF